MRSQLSQEEIIKKRYPNLERIISFSNYCRVLTPYSDTDQKTTRFFTIQNLENTYHISEESYLKTAKQNKGLVVDLKLLKLQRNFKSTSFLVESTENFVYFSNYCEMKRKCKQKVEDLIILKLLKFIIKCKQQQIENQISLKSLVITDLCQFKLYDLKLYAIKSSFSNNAKITYYQNIKNYQHKKQPLEKQDDSIDKDTKSLYEIFNQILKTNNFQNLVYKKGNTSTLFSIHQYSESYVQDINQNRQKRQQKQSRCSKRNSNQKEKENLNAQDLNAQELLLNMQNYYSKNIITLVKLILQHQDQVEKKIDSKEILLIIENLQNKAQNNLKYNLQERNKNMSATICSQINQTSKQQKNQEKLSDLFTQKHSLITPFLKKKNNGKNFQLFQQFSKKKIFFSFFFCFLHHNDCWAGYVYIFKNQINDLSKIINILG